MSQPSSQQQRLAALALEAGYREDEPLVVGVQLRDEPPTFHAQGLTPTSLVYAASLSKQVTAACVALLVRQGALEPDSVLSRWLPRLPAWAEGVRIRQLLHHTAALPADDELDGAMPGGGADRTSRGVIGALRRFPTLKGEPGHAFAYSNAGYVCLAEVVARAAGQALPSFAGERIFAPTAMRYTSFWPGPAPAPPGAVPLTPRHPAPLSLGDGGVWSTAADLLRWSRALNDDELGVSALMQTPGRLDDGTVIDYAWGMGVRSHGGHRVYRHGGGWRGLRAMQARIPLLGLSLVLLAVGDDTERRVELVNGLLDEVTRAA
ncbi:serine hydrolase domain-containing protein [Nonomuraea sp. NPDC050643]|uniref:serine hydrolase domain-containing protein n=1 Tax=Nonomuraea sp. NPDC050643 TaxID=3155660 RepID=UPI0033C9DBEA